jgi:hypothetical protein
MRRRGRSLRGVGATTKDERVVLLRKEQGGGRQRIHKSWGKGLGGRRLTGGRRIRAELAADTLDPDKKLRRPGGAIDLEKGEEREETGGDFIGAAGCRIWQGIKRIEEGRKLRMWTWSPS